MKDVSRANAMTFAVTTTLLFITASSEIYQTPFAAADPSAQQQTQIVYKTIPATSPSLIDTMDRFSNLTSQIETLERQVEIKDDLVYIIKVQKELALEDQTNQYQEIDQGLAHLYTYVGKTPYVLGASTTRAWDCSGLTLWFYETYRGIELPHSATAQQRQGQVVDAPIPGDLVAFVHNGYKNAYHIGVYVGGGLFIHALNPQRDTVLDNVQNFAEKENSRVEYIRYP